jgi:hypoxanthine phosphoribosyltransferase
VVGTGLSGALVVPYLGRALSKYWLIVRKNGDSSHSNFWAEGELGARWLFVDDQVETGKTRQHVREVIDKIAATSEVGNYVRRNLLVPVRRFVRS